MSRIIHKNAYLAWEDRQPMSGVMPGPEYERVKVTCRICGEPTPVVLLEGETAEDKHPRCANCAVNGRH